jgi:heat shock protein HtpX
MYIINPFRQKGRAASDLTSTHPPVSERIRILRSMAGGASFTDYQRSYLEVHKSGKGGIPASTLAGAGAAALAARAPETAEREPEKIERARETSDLLWKYSNYSLVNCECGTKLRIPPKFKGKTIRCPHCGILHSVPTKQK